MRVIRLEAWDKYKTNIFEFIYDIQLIIKYEELNNN